jgi:XRE family aerobic/anaerobic benzoate catabolism transcriptional regulator
MTAINGATTQIDKLPETVLLHNLGTRLRRIRANKSLSRKALSNLADISERHIAQLESGKGNISILLLARLATALELDLGDLFYKSDNSGSMEQIMINDLVQQMNPADRQQALQLLLDQFVTSNSKKSRLALIGIRGAGKTTLGKRLSKEYGILFIQLGSEIQRLAGMDVSEILSLGGQDYYRRLEEKALMETLKKHDNCIIEAGGSIVTELNLLNLLLKSCHVVWVSARAEDHMQRVIDQGDTRPIENNDDAMSDLRRLMQQRETFYKRAHSKIETSGRSIDVCMQELTEIFPPLNKIMYRT